ncbi:MAG: cellulase family glycosylhydrolase [Treponema sp.]|nr:cellulase family glycosylhydrolase [Treponema sp.]
MKKVFFIQRSVPIVVSMIMVGLSACQTPVRAGDAVPAHMPFSRGVNFSAWFEAPSPRAIPFTAYTEQDIKNVKSLGADVIRVPINMHSMTSGFPDYIVDPLFFDLFDRVVDWAEQQQLYLIIDNHSFDPVAATASDIATVLIPVWTQIAQQYKDRSGYVLYEILNEPHGIAAQSWGQIQEAVIAAIRAVDRLHTIIVGGVDYNAIDALFKLPHYADSNLIYTFHFYDPYLFTHQGETWGAPPNLKNLRGMPFPAQAHALPDIPTDLKGTWIEQSINTSYRHDADPHTLAETLDKAVQFSRERGGVPLLCGEFGVYIPNSLPEDRVRWYQTVTALLDERNIIRTSWDYFGGFGIFKTAQNGSFESDLNSDIVKALGFTVPPQKPPETIRTTCTVYDNYPSSLVRVEHWNSDVDWYYPHAAKEYALSWGNAAQYGSLSFNFRQPVDWDYLRAHDYALTVVVKTDKAARFDLRFVDREDETQIPWRIHATVDLIPDGTWHTVRIPLSTMVEHGAWLNATQTWLNPEGRFSWAAINSMDIVAEDGDLFGITVIFDSITIAP